MLHHGSRLVLVLSLLVGALFLTSFAGCGGGGDKTPDPVLLSSTSKTVGAAGGSITASAQSVTISVLPNSIGTTNLTLNVFDDTAIPLANPNLPSRSNTVNLPGISALTPGGSITVTQPYTGEVDTTQDFVMLADTVGNNLAVQPTFDTAKGSISYTINSDDLNSLSQMGGSKTRLSMSGVSANLRHLVPAIADPYLSIDRFKDGITILPGRTWDCWDHNAVQSDWSGKRVALVIHGINSDLRDMNAMAYYLKNLLATDNTPFYSDVYGVDYRFKSSIKGNANILGTALLSHNANQVEVYGYSMGGLVARWAIEKGGASGCVKRLFTFGTPHNGVPARGVKSLAALVSVGGTLLFDITQPGINDLIHGGIFLGQLNDSSTHSGVQYYTFAGKRWDNWNVGIAVHAIYTGNDNNMDGIVPVSSAKYSGLSAKCGGQWVNSDPSACYNMNHLEMSGSGQEPSFSLDKDSGHPTLISFIGAGIGGTTIYGTKTNAKDNAPLLWVPGATFTMGSAAGVGYGDERPAHQVTLSGYWIYKNDVTVAQYRAFCTATGRALPSFPTGYNWAGKTGWNDPALQQHPIVNVTWYDAKAYADWAGVRLPTEAQWEYAARGPQGRNYPWGGTATAGDPYNGWDDTKCANYYNSYAVGKSTWPVGSFPAGASWCGAQDMAGNVWQWCGDWYGNYSPTPVTNPTGPTTGDFRVLRGGSWGDYNYIYYRSADRINGRPDLYSDYVGFRCCSLSPGP
ncbi:MAG: SUMF1/EgtB/PvdO family nonheme iron enzyme [bacterium]